MPERRWVEASKARLGGEATWQLGEGGKLPDSQQLKPYVPLIFGTVVMFGAAVVFGIFIGWMIWGR